MSKKFGIIILVILALTLSACNLNASDVPTPTQPKKNQQVKASQTVDPAGMNSVEAAASQTAAASGGQPNDGSTPDPLLDNATATPGGGLDLPTLDPSIATPTGDVHSLSTVTPIPAVQPTVQTTRPATYTLHEGEFIFCLARRFNVNVDQTLALNGLRDSEPLQPGFVVKIPTSGSFDGVRALRPHPTTYTVRSGDSVYSIACLYGDVDPLNIAAVNGLAAPYNLTTGSTIKIP